MRRLIILTLVLTVSLASLSARPKAVIETNHGEIWVALYEKDAPETVANFMRYAEEGLYDGVVFHRVLPGFILQSGGYVEEDGRLRHIDLFGRIKSEADNGLYNIKGTLAMARSGRDPDSATSEFFINLDSNKELNYKGEGSKPVSYTVFGKVYKGWDVIGKIAAIPVETRGPFKAYPVEEAVVRTVRIIREEGVGH